MPRHKYSSLPAATKLRQGNVFTPVCSRGGLCPGGAPPAVRLCAAGTHPAGMHSYP